MQNNFKVLIQLIINEGVKKNMLLDWYEAKAIANDVIRLYVLQEGDATKGINEMLDAGNNETAQLRFLKRKIKLAKVAAEAKK